MCLIAETSQHGDSALDCHLLVHISGNRVSLGTSSCDMSLWCNCRRLNEIRVAIWPKATKVVVHSENEEGQLQLRKKEFERVTYPEPEPPFSFLCGLRL